MGHFTYYYFTYLYSEDVAEISSPLLMSDSLVPPFLVDMRGRQLFRPSVVEAVVGKPRLGLHCPLSQYDHDDLSPSFWSRPLVKSPGFLEKYSMYVYFMWKAHLLLFPVQLLRGYCSAHCVNDLDSIMYGDFFHFKERLVLSFISTSPLEQFEYPL